MRLCLIHPDIELLTAYLPENAGRQVSSLHHGFIGEERIVFTSNFDATALDAAFIFRPIYSPSDWQKLMADNPGLKLIVFPGAEEVTEALQTDPVYGLSEMNRKPLVRGARIAIVPDTIASVALVALYPLAAHLMLPPELEIKVKAPADVASAAHIRTAGKEISENLSKVQSSFAGGVRCVYSGSEDSERSMRLSIELPFDASLDETFRIYDSIYDDHRFTFMVSHPVSTAEVEGTHKVILSFSKPEAGCLRIEAVADPRMRGGASEGIHLLNLLFSLDEKTGLNLKAGRWSGSLRKQTE